MQFPQFESVRLQLTSIEKQDIENLFALYSDPEVVKYYDLEAFTELSQVTDIIDFFHTRFFESSGIRWAIRLKGCEQLIGTCGFNTWSLKMKNAVVGYDLRADCWGNGYVTEALHRIIAAAFDGELPCGVLHRIQADTVPGNTASERVLTKVGFQQEGRRRDAGFWKNQFHDLTCFGLIRTDYQALRK